MFEYQNLVGRLETLWVLVQFRETEAEMSRDGAATALLPKRATAAKNCLITTISKLWCCRSKEWHSPPDFSTHQLNYDGNWQILCEIGTHRLVRPMMEIALQTHGIAPTSDEIPMSLSKTKPTEAQSCVW